MNKKTILILIVIVLLAAGGGIFYVMRNQEPPFEPAPILNDKDATSHGITAVVNGNNQFALNLYAALKKREGNTFFSSYSLSTALAMAHEGARGRTAEEMRSVLGLPADGNARRPAFAAVHNRLNKPSGYRLAVANAIWVQEEYPILKEYLDLLEHYFDGKATPVDFTRAPEEVREAINGWVAKKTGGKIADLLTPGTFDRMTRLILTNAIYFKGTWSEQFDPANTKEGDFRTGPSKNIKVPMMHQGAVFNYTKDDRAQVLEMAYEGEILSMIVVLPAGDRISTVEDLLTLEKLDAWRSGLHRDLVYAVIPKFTMRARYDNLIDTLSAMGMRAPFLKDADFSGMDGTHNLFIQEVVHEAYVDVHERGTEAAAATSVKAVEAKPQLFRADHPFLFFIMDRSNGHILFMGRVSDPTQL